MEQNEIIVPILKAINDLRDEVRENRQEIKEMKVERVIIGKQYETCDNYEEFKKIVNSKKINVNII